MFCPKNVETEHKWNIYIVRLIDCLWLGGTEQRKKPQLMFCVSAKVLATLRHYSLGSFFFGPWGFYKSEPESNLELLLKRYSSYGTESGLRSTGDLLKASVHQDQWGLKPTVHLFIHSLNHSFITDYILFCVKVYGYWTHSYWCFMVFCATSSMFILGQCTRSGKDGDSWGWYKAARLSTS